MSGEVQALKQKLNLDKKIKYNHDISGRVLPFFTRNNERAKFKNGFDPITGVVAREINGESADLPVEQTEIDTSQISTEVSSEKVNSLFSADKYQGMHNAKLIQYIPLSAGPEREGEMQIGDFLVQLLCLEKNNNLQQWFQTEKPNNLYEKVVFAALTKRYDSKNRRKQNFIFRNQDKYARLFEHDINNMMLDKDYFYNHINLILKYYYFFYITQLLTKVGRHDVDNHIQPLYYLLENESVSQSRQAIKRGYNLVIGHGKDLLTDVDTINYLNVLIPDDTFYWKDEILSSDFEYQVELLNNLQEFLPAFSAARSLEEAQWYRDNRPQNLSAAISILQRWLTEKTDATNSRYPKSFEEIAKQGFISQHGRLGYTLNMSNDVLLMLTAVIVGHKKMLLEQVFVELRERGVFLDRLTRDQVVALYEQTNVLEKLSDSGDAQYVKGVL